MHRAYALIEQKSVNAERRSFSGFATTPEADRVGDIVESSGAQFAAQLPLLLYHDAERPVGSVKLQPPTVEGIRFEAQLADIAEPRNLRDRIEEAWQSVKSGLIRGVSIGFRVLDDGVELLKSGGIRFTKIEILELSLVAIPANYRATIDSVKSFALLPDAAALSRRSPSRATVDPTGATVLSKTGRTTMKSFTERKSALAAERTSKLAALNALLAPEDAGETMNEEQQTKFDDLQKQIDALDGECTRLEAAERLNKAAALAVAERPEAPAAPAAPVVQIREQAPKGIGFARVVICKANAFLSQGYESALQVAQRMYPHDARVLEFFQKAAVHPGTTGAPAFVGALIPPPSLAAEFLDFMRPETILGKFGVGPIPPLVNVPFNVRVNGQTSGGAAYWVGEGKPKPLTSFAFDTQSLLWTKVATIAVLTDESVRFSSPSAEQLVRAALSAAIAERMDLDFIDPANAGVANVKPKSITNGVTPLTSAGNTSDKVRQDIQALVAAYTAAGGKLSRLVLIMPSTLAVNLSLLVNALGQTEFPGMGNTGGVLLGFPVIASEYAQFAPSPGGPGALVVAVDSGRVALADDGQVTVDASQQASLEMSDAPTQDGSVGTGAALVSLWQNNMLGLRAERFVNWAKLRAGAVQYITDVKWGQ